MDGECKRAAEYILLLSLLDEDNAMLLPLLQFPAILKRGHQKLRNKYTDDPQSGQVSHALYGHTWTLYTLLQLVSLRFTVYFPPRHLSG